MKLTADLILRSPYSMSPIKERELDLRGNKIPAIENLGATNDAFDSIDLSDNEISRLENFPLLSRLTTLLLSNNRIAHVAAGIPSTLPNLRILVLTGNRISSIKELDSLRGMPSLEHLSLVDNPVSRMPNYRLFVISAIPSLRFLDFRRIRQRERQDAKRMFAAGKGDANAGQQEKDEGLKGESKETAGDTTAMSKKAQEVAIKAAIEGAKTISDVESLERALAAGKVPNAATGEDAPPGM